MVNGVYSVSESGDTGFTPLPTLKERAFKAADEFAKSKGTTPEVVNVLETPAGFGRFPNVEVRFRLAAQNKTPKAQSSSSLVIDTSVDTEKRITVSKDSDLYQELKKLGELRDKGLLTEAEFQKEKDRLMAGR